MYLFNSSLKQVKSKGQARKERVIIALALLLFFITSVKIVLTVQANPLIAYPNNGDFAREQACYGVLNSSPGLEDKHAVNHDAPIKRMIYDGEKNYGWCVFSSDNVFLWLATLFHDVGDYIDFRFIGMLRAIFVIGAVALAMNIATTVENKLLISLSFLLTMGDITYLSFFNTLFSNFMAVFGAYLCGLAILLLWKSKKLSVIIFALVAIITLGFSKQQFLPLATLVAVLLALMEFIRHRRRRVATLFIIISIAIPIIFKMANPATNGCVISSNKANKFHTFLLTVLPASKDPVDALKRVGLPEHCKSGLGHDWYGLFEHEGKERDSVCPEVYSLSRLRLLPLFFEEPRTFIIPVRNAINKNTIFQLALNNTETKKERESPRYRFLRATSIATYLDQVFPKYAVLLSSVSVIIGIICGIITFVRIEKAPELYSMTAFGGLIVAYTVASSVFGDGYFEITKHAIAVWVGYSLQITVAVCGICEVFKKRQKLHNRSNCNVFQSASNF